MWTCSRYRCCCCCFFFSNIGQLTICSSKLTADLFCVSEIVGALLCKTRTSGSKKKQQRNHWLLTRFLMARHCIRSRACLSVVASLFDDDDADDNDDDDDAVAGANQHNLVLFFHFITLISKSERKWSSIGCNGYTFSHSPLRNTIQSTSSVRKSVGNVILDFFLWNANLTHQAASTITLTDWMWVRASYLLQVYIIL